MTDNKDFLKNFYASEFGPPPRIAERPSHAEEVRRHDEIVRQLAVYEEEKADPGGALLRYWDEGRGDFEKVERMARFLFTKAKYSEDEARRHWYAIERVAEGPGDVPAVHMLLQHCFLKGWVVDKSPAKALYHLERAIELGSDNARWFYAMHLFNPGQEGLDTVLPPDPKRALSILRDVLKHSKDTSTVDLARRSAAAHIANTSSISEVSSEDRKLVDEYAGDMRGVMSVDFLPLALFYACAADGDDYSGPEYEKPRGLLIAGSQSSNDRVRATCLAQLDAWGVRPVPEPERTMAQKSGEVLKSAAIVGGIGGIMWVWASIGIVLTGIAAMANAIVLPIIAVGAAVVLLVRRWGRR